MVEVFCEALQHDIPQVRMGAAYTPGEIGDIRAAEPLPVTLRGENLGLEKTAAWVLSQIGGPRVPEVLCEALSQKDIVIIAGAYEFLSFTVHQVWRKIYLKFSTTSRKTKWPNCCSGRKIQFFAEAPDSGPESEIMNYYWTHSVRTGMTETI
ncbi:hypothetical protein M15_05100 [Atrimonas thermophila]